MQPCDFKEFSSLITDAHAFYGKDVSAFGLDVWWQAMKPFDLSAVRDALGRHAMNPDKGQFAPKPADVIAMIGGGTQDAALDAWAKVDRAVREVGMYRSVAFDDPLIHRVIHDMGGWTPLGRKGDDEWPFVAREFMNRYRGFRMRSESPSYPPVLIGQSEGDCRERNQRIQQPVLIGKPELAKQVMAGGSNEPVLAITHLDRAVKAQQKRVTA